MNVKIGFRLAIGFGFVIPLMILLTTFSVMNMSQADRNHNIASAAEQQGQVARDIDDGIASIRSLAQEVDEVAEATRQEGENLQTLSSRLLGNLKAFQL